MKLLRLSIAALLRSPKWVQTLQALTPQLVGGLEHFLFSHILGIIFPTDKLIFFRGVGQPPTSTIIEGFSWHIDLWAMWKMSHDSHVTMKPNPNVSLTPGQKGKHCWAPLFRSTVSQKKVQKMCNEVWKTSVIPKEVNYSKYI